ncbi:MAG: general secretion pathway protein GspB [Rhodospirillales bacterium]|nr:general secretion pathway protein GspB [Rhodospirillales bacterium]
MSFILDALKKSESARQRQAGPSLFEVKVAAPRRGLPVWAAGLGALLLIIIAVLGWMLWRRPARQHARGGAVPGVSQEMPLAARSRTGGAPLRGPPPAQPRAGAAQSSTPLPAYPAGNPGGAPAAAAAALPGPASRSQPPSGAPTGPPPSELQPAADAGPADFAPAMQPAAPTGAASQPVEANLPRYQDLAAAPDSSLPRLHLDLHVYDANPRKRYVMINMHKLRQGDSLPDGVAVLSIRPDGVVLSYQGRQFLLPR